MASKPSAAPLLLAAVAGLLVLFGAAWWLLGSGPETDAAPVALSRPAVNASPAAAVTLPAVDGGAPVTGTLAATPLDLPPAAGAETGPPASYVRALAALTGRVVEEDGSPVPRLAVELLGGRRSTIMRSLQAFAEEGGLAFDPVAGRAMTDEEGRFRMERIEPDTIGMLLLDPGGPRARLHLLEITPVSGAERDLGDIVLPGGATIAGRVLDQRGEPLPGVRVRALDVPMAELAAPLAEIRPGGGVSVAAGNISWDERELVYVPDASLVAQVDRRLPIPTVFTDRDGRFELADLKPGMISIFLDEPAHVAVARSGLPTGPAGGRRDHGDFVLSAGEPALGLVLDGQGRPLAGASVLAGNPLGMAPVTLLKGAGAVTDADGRFRVPGLRPGSITIAARAPGDTVWHPLEARTNRNDTVLRLPASRRAVLEVLDPGGQPVEALTVFGRSRVPEDDVPDWLMPPLPLADRLTRGEQGEWIVQPLEPEHWQLILRAPDCADERLALDLRLSDGQRSVTLKPSGQVLVTVVDALSGEPVEHALVEIVNDPGDLESPLASRRSDARGEARLQRLPPTAGTLHAVASHPAYASAVESFPLPAEGPVTVALGRGARVLGLVTDRGGPPAERLLVILGSEDFKGENVPLRTTLTDAQGGFAFERVPAGKAMVQVRPRRQLELGASFLEGFFESPLAEAEDLQIPPTGDVEVLLSLDAAFADVETAELAGQLLVNGAPGAGWKLYTFGSIRRIVTADDAGRFDLGLVEAGDVSVLASPAGTGIMTGAVERFSVQLQANERRHEVLRLETGAIEGRVVDAATGAPVEGVAVRVAPEGSERAAWGRGVTVLTDPSGRFRNDAVAAGRYRLRTDVDGYAAGASQVVEVRSLGTASGVTIRLHRPLTVSGRVVIEGVTGPAPRWAWLSAQAEDGRRVSARVNSNTLEYRMVSLSPGTWTFHLASDKGPLQPLERTVQSDAQDLTLVFRPQVEDDDG